MTVISYRHFKADEPEQRQLLIDAITEKLLPAFQKDSEATKFVIAVPKESENDELSLFTIEEYSTPNALDKHSTLLQDFHAYHSSHPKLKIGSPPTTTGPFTPTITFTRPSISKTPKENIYIILANFGYKPSTTGTAVIGWNELVKTVERTEEGTLTYTVCEDEKDSYIRTVEAYESREYCSNVHLKGEGIAENGRQNGEFRTGAREVFRLKMVAGFWG